MKITYQAPKFKEKNIVCGRKVCATSPLPQNDTSTQSIGGVDDVFGDF